MSSGSYAGLLQAALVAAMLFAIPVALLTSAAYSRIRRASGRLAPSSHALLLLVLAALPFASAIAGLLATLTPSMLSWLGLAADHCHLHPDHPHLCLLHPPPLSASAATAWLLLAAGVAAALAAGPWLLHYVRTRRAVSQLLSISRHDAARGVHVVPVDTPLAFAAGLSSPHLFISRSLLEHLTPGQIDAVLAHERAHAARLDVLRQSGAAILSWLHVPHTRRCLLADLELAAERSCDEVAAVVTGDRLLVAEAIVCVERLFAAQPRQASPLFSSHFTDSNVAARVQSMLAPAPDAASLARPAWLGLCMALLLLGAAGGPLHHTTESLLGLLFH